MKRFLIVPALLAALVLASCSSTGDVGTPAALSGEVRLSIVHTNDVHARVSDSKTEWGYARIATIVKDLRASNPNTLLLDAGDVFHGQPIANLERGASVSRLMNQLGYDAMTLGNHDFNYGQERLLELTKQIRHPVLAANVYKNGQRLFRPWEIKVIGGLRVGLFGLATPETAYKTDPRGIDGITFRDPVSEARAIVGELRPKVDVLICISHLGVDTSSDPNSLSLASAVPGIDLIVDGHSHTSLEVLQALNKTGVQIVQAGEYGKFVGVVDLVIGTDRRISSINARSLSPASMPDVAADASAKAVIDEIKAAQAPMLAVKVGSTAETLVGVREQVRTSPTNLGTLIATSMLVYTKADVALLNGGGIRDSIPAGEITKELVFKVLPFGNNAQTIKVSGAVLKAALENGVSKLPAADGRFPHVAGATFRIDPAAPVGSRILDLKVAGKVVSADASYILAVPNFLVNGGDEYTMLKLPVINDFPSDAEMLFSYFQTLAK